MRFCKNCRARKKLATRRMQVPHEIVLSDSRRYRGKCPLGPRTQSGKICIRSRVELGLSVAGGGVYVSGTNSLDIWPILPLYALQRKEQMKYITAIGTTLHDIT